ncbi:hypothetical protein [Campylobacter cuniculorum]|uniref:capsular polysaccharide export protein, LipB/KpsS family n=1 Tax=Campylobacter cuniculorum TaxID=374106 RepID=UPI0006848AB0|nr:hypothetical protein [Campylobacter cuniculorum]
MGGGISDYIKTLAKDKANYQAGMKTPFRYFFDTQIKTLSRILIHSLSTHKIQYLYECRKNQFLRVPKFEIAKQARFIKKLKKLYDYLSVKPNFNEDKKIIYYSLHMEPEASIIPRAVLNSQLFIIKMLSHALPKDYVIYVKEHPDQFFIYENNKGFLCNINHYRDLSFYWQLKQIPNVKIIDINTSSLQLVKNSKAVSTIAGTVLLEAVLLKKPILIFGKNLSVLELLKESFTICSQNEVNFALEKIKQGFNPEYKDLNQILDEYCFTKSDLTQNKKFLLNIFKYCLKI